MKKNPARYLGVVLPVIIAFCVTQVAGYLLYLTGIIQIKPVESALLSAAFAINSILTVLIFLKGRTRDGKDGAMYTLVAISLKFLVEMMIALMWFVAAKKTGMPYILLFFVLYLTFSLCSIIILLNILKKKSL